MATQCVSTALAILTCLLTAGLVSAQQPPSEFPSEVIDAGGEAVDPEVPPELQDPAFDQYVDVRRLSAAWRELHPAALADVGLQLAEGERVLFRQHKVASAETVLRMAIRAAAERRDQETLERLGRATKALKLKNLTTAIEAAQKLAAEPRSAPKITVDLNQVSKELIQFGQAVIDEIERRRIRGHREALTALGKQIAEIEQMPDGTKHSIQNAITDAVSAISETNAPEHELLDKLSGVSRIGYRWRMYNYTSRTVYLQIFSFGPLARSPVLEIGYPGSYRFGSLIPNINVYGGFTRRRLYTVTCRYRDGFGAIVESYNVPPRTDWRLMDSGNGGIKLHQPGT